MDYRRYLLAVLIGVLACPLAIESVVASGGGASARDDAMALHASLGLSPQVVRLSAAGYMLDFRYRVLETERAAKLINRDTDPYLIHEASGMKVVVPEPPKVGPLRNTGRHLEAGRTYFILFANPARKIQRGDRVTVVLGEQRIEHLLVQ